MYRHFIHVFKVKKEFIMNILSIASSGHKRLRTTLCAVVGASLLSVSNMYGDVIPHRLFSDHAVLQQGVKMPVWGTARDGEKVSVEFAGQKVSTIAKEGAWRVELSPMKAGGPYTMTIKGDNTVVLNDVLVGEVWLASGQSNMEFALAGAKSWPAEKARADLPKVRMFTVGEEPAVEPRTQLTGGNWVVSSPDTAAAFSAVGYFFARDIHAAKGVPVGIIHSSWGGTWIQTWMSIQSLDQSPLTKSLADSARRRSENYEQALAEYPAKMAVYNAQMAEWRAAGGPEQRKALESWQVRYTAAYRAGLPFDEAEPVITHQEPNKPVSPNGRAGQAAVLFNGRIAPIMPFPIKGVIWYQGESNAFAAADYQEIFSNLMKDWRQLWQQPVLPFLFVQIAPHKGMSPDIREAQLLTSKSMPHTALVVTTDVGDAEDIHPTRKEPVGARLALAARALAYGEKIVFSGPVYESMRVEGNRAIIEFSHIGGGLMAKDGPLKGFAVAGKDLEYVEANATIQNGTVVVSSDQVAVPYAVRYGWDYAPEVNLFNAEGLPASPFRTHIPVRNK
jgi:sialate O-acetylesterase